VPTTQTLSQDLDTHSTPRVQTEAVGSVDNELHSYITSRSCTCSHHHLSSYYRQQISLSQLASESSSRSTFDTPTT